MSEADEVVVNFFALCDQVITEAGTGKQSLIGIYSALMAEQIPTHVNIAVAIGLRVQSSRQRELYFRLTDPAGTTVFQSPGLPFDWHSLEGGLRNSGYATVQIGLNLRAVPLTHFGVYTSVLICEGNLLATYPIAVMPVQTH